MRKLTFLFALLLSLVGVTKAWAQITEEFTTENWPEDWSLSTAASETDYYIEYDSSNDYSYPSGRRGVYGQVSSGTTKYIITPVVNGSGSFKFKRRNSSNGSVYVYTYDNGTLSSSPIVSNTSKPTSFTTVSFSGVKNMRLAIVLNGRMDNFTYTLGVEASCKAPKNLVASNVTDESATITWDADDADTWNLRYKADGDAEYTEVDGLKSASYDLTSLYAATTYTVEVQTVCSMEDQSAWTSVEFTTPLCSPSVQKTISYELSDKYSDGWNGASITVTDVTSGIVVGTITMTSGGSASGTVALCPNREFSFTWTKGSYDNECGYTIKDVDGNDLYTLAQGSSPSAGAIGDNYSWSNTPVGDGAKFAIDKNTFDFGVKNANESAEQTFTVTNNGNADMTVSFASDNADFTVPNYVLFTDVLGWGNVNVHYWGGETSTTWPGVAMTEIGTNEYNQKQFRAIIPVDVTSIIFNNGSGAQTIDLAYANGTEGYYTINEQEDGKYKAGSWNNGPGWNVAAGESREFTVKMNTETAGVKSGNITLSYTAVNGTEKIIPVSGTVMPAGAEVVDFNSAIPSTWNNESNGWSIDNGAAKCTGKKNLTTQKLDFSADEAPFFIMKVKASDSGSGDYVTVEGSSDNGTTWTAFDKKTYSYPSDFGANTGDYSTIVVSIPNTVNKLRFNGYYVLIDEIAGLKFSDNDPVMGVYTDAECTAANKVSTTSVMANFDFVTTDPTPVIYNIKNDGTGTMVLSKNDVAGLTITLDKTSVAAGEKATLTIAMPVADNGGYHGGDVVVTAEDLGTFTVMAQGVVEEEGKQNLDFTTDAIPTTWTTNNWSKNASGYVEVGYSSSTMQTSVLVAEAGETLVVLAKQSYTSSSYTFGVKYRLVGDEDWSDLIPAANIGTSYVMLHGTIADAGNYELQFIGNYTQIKRIYGLSKPTAPEMVVYDGATVAGASFGFGKVTDEKDETHEFTVKNEGLATLTGLAAALSGNNADHYTVTITGATGDNNDEIEAGAEATVTVTQLKDNLGAHSATLTISATGLDSKVIALSGNTVDHTALDVDFDTSSAWPAEILQHNGWSTYYSTYTNDGYAYNSSSTAASLILTPLTVADVTDKLTFQAKYYSSSSRDLTVRYTTDGGITWNDYICSDEEPKTSFKSQIGYSFSNLEVTNIPAGTVAFDFYGKSIYLDNIAGDMKVTSAPLVEFATVSDNISGANLSADVTATYTLANKGNAAYVGTVALTNVTAEVTGEDVTFEENTLTIPAGKTATITVTMAYAAPYVEKTGSMVITSESWVGDINVNYTATLIDPTDFVEDFAGNAKPAGWYSENWTYANGVAYVNTGTAKPMITELVGTETGKNTLSFDTKLYNDYGYGTYTLSVYTSTDRKNWGEAKQVVTLTNENQTVTLDALADGKYYVKFEAANAIVDNIKGVKRLDAPAHDLYEVSATMAATGIPSASYTATVVGVSLRADETVTAELWLRKGDEYNKVAELTEQTMTVNTNKTFTLTGNLPDAEGEYKMWVTVKNDDTFFNTDEIDFTLTHTHTMAITTFPNAAAVQADDNNEYTGTFFVTVQNTGSAAIAANDVSVSLINNTDAESTFTSTWTAENSNVLYMNTKKDDTDIATDCTLKAWCWNTDTDGEWIAFTKVNDGFWSLDLNGKTNFIVCRFNPSGTDENPWSNVWNQSGDLSLANGNLVKFNGYNEKALTFTSESMSYLEPTMTTTLKVTVTGTLTDGENASFSFKARENFSNTYYGNGLTSSVSVTAAPVIALDETTAPTEIATGTNRKVTLARKFNKGWNTVCLPFEISDLTVFGTDAVAYSFDDYDTEEKALTFNKVTTLTAATPYVIYVPEAINSTLTFRGVTVEDTYTTAGTSSYNGVIFQGTYAPIAAGEWGASGVVYGLTTDGHIRKAGANASIKGFRAYFDIPAGAEVKAISFDDIEDAISLIQTDAEENDAIYNVAGQRVQKMQKGINIINGKKILK